MAYRYGVARCVGGVRVDEGRRWGQRHGFAEGYSLASSLTNIDTSSGDSRLVRWTCMRNSLVWVRWWKELPHAHAWMRRGCRTEQGTERQGYQPQQLCSCIASLITRLRACAAVRKCLCRPPGRYCKLRRCFGRLRTGTSILATFSKCGLCS